MIILNFVPQNLSSYEIKNIKRGLRSFFEYGDGSQCDVSENNVYKIYLHLNLLVRSPLYSSRRRP